MSRKILRQLTELIEQRGGEEWVWELILNERTVRHVTRLLKWEPERPDGVSYQLFMQWVKGKSAAKAGDIDEHGTTRKQRYDMVMQLKADVLAEEGLDLIDGADETDAASVASRKNRAGYRMKLAQIYNRERYGQGDKGKLVINADKLFLEALQSGAASPREQIEDAEFEALPPGTPDDDDEIDIDELTSL